MTNLSEGEAAQAPARGRRRRWFFARRSRLLLAVAIIFAAVVAFGVTQHPTRTRSAQASAVAVHFPTSIDDYERLPETDSVVSFAEDQMPRLRTLDPAFAKAKPAVYGHDGERVYVLAGMLPAATKVDSRSDEIALVRRINKFWWSETDPPTIVREQTDDGEWWCEPVDVYCIGVDKTSIVIVDPIGNDFDGASGIAIATQAREAIVQISAANAERG